MSYPGYGGHGGYGAPMPGAPTHGMQMVAGPGGYQAYGAYPGSFSGAPVNDPMWSYFTAVAGQDGEIDSEELQRCLTQTGISGTYSPFSIETCRIMIAMLDVSFEFWRYRISAQTLNGILKRYSKNGRIFFDDYVACCVKLRALTVYNVYNGNLNTS
ncbi:Grancalcin [Acipenser ruthenus]|uniref:Grancalcin n=1 Tax=Acipenser ruthenus TaxID=7906 RepID=A0A444TYW1_ACIRT|nr:Grancalcin [Acipenser ruthenus]